jgi:hemoglobin-like flavoprotein
LEAGFLEAGFLETGFSRHTFSTMSFSSAISRKTFTDLLDDAADAMAPTNPIEHSFELAAERCDDLTPLVYHRLFRAHPEAEAMFRSEGSDLVKGSMLALAIDAILDFSGERSGHFRLIECEVISHDAYGTPRKLFGEFFGVIADTIREILGADWSPEIEDAWRRLLAELDQVVAHQAESVGTPPSSTLDGHLPA